MTQSPPVALTIAGSDCSAGAGAQADLKSFRHFGVYGLTALSCVVAETSREVGSVHPVPPGILREQVDLLLRSFPVAAVKTGMLFSAPHVEAVAAAVANLAAPLVVDPVMIASTGDPLLEPDAVDAYRSLLLPRADLITPNLDETARLAGAPITGREDMIRAGRRLAAEFDAAVLVKGGHLDRVDCEDILIINSSIHSFSASRIDCPASHGTGCTLSAAITAGLARGRSLREAVADAKEFLGAVLGDCFGWADPAGRPIHALGF